MQLSFLHSFIYKLSSVPPQKYIPRGLDAIKLCSRHKLKRFVWRNSPKDFSDLRFHHFTGFTEVYSSHCLQWTMLYQHYHRRIFHLRQIFEKIHESEFQHVKISTPHANDAWIRVSQRHQRNIYNSNLSRTIKLFYHIFGVKWETRKLQSSNLPLLKCGSCREVSGNLIS